MWAWGWAIVGVALAAIGVEWWLVRRERRRHSRIKVQRFGPHVELVQKLPPLEEPKVLGRITPRGHPNVRCQCVKCGGLVVTSAGTSAEPICAACRAVVVR